ncbi:MAG: hypothetical protein SWI22_14615 [Pseudomonadota bacterium]|nr:hypothetical protein [Pseudomonadota bacterium]
MRRTVLALLAATAMVAGCQQPAEAPAPAAETAAPTPEMPVDAPPQEEVDPAAAGPAGEPGSCLAEIGGEAAAKLVERCVMVSPATHPPCNVANPCAMIQGEIDRSCGQYGPDEAKPSQCGA